MKAATIRINEILQTKKKTENEIKYHEEEATQTLLFSTLLLLSKKSQKRRRGESIKTISKYS